jgi:uncharacterized protein (TIGR01777 family)
LKIIITGATGFVGRNLVPTLLKQQHAVFLVGRDSAKIYKVFGANVTALTWNQLENIPPDDIDAVINIAGENIGDGLWTQAKKARIKTSRINAANQIVKWALSYQQKKPHIYNASAIGIYGLQNNDNNESFIETSPIPFGQPTDFLSDVAQAWESALKPAIEAGIPVTFMRFAVVLKCRDGILKKLELPYSLGLGSILGNGQQPFTWIHIDDLIAGIHFLLSHPEVTGPINFCAPDCTSQKAFAKTLASAMNRPLIIKTPNWVVKTFFGQMGEELLLKGQHVAPQRLIELGFKFNYADLSTLFGYLKSEYGHIDSGNTH